MTMTLDEGFVEMTAGAEGGVGRTVAGTVVEHAVSAAMRVDAATFYGTRYGQGSDGVVLNATKSNSVGSWEVIEERGAIDGAPAKHPGQMLVDAGGAATKVGKTLRRILMYAFPASWTCYVVRARTDDVLYLVHWSDLWMIPPLARNFAPCWRGSFFDCVHWPVTTSRKLPHENRQRNQSFQSVKNLDAPTQPAANAEAARRNVADSKRAQ